MDGQDSAEHNTTAHTVGAAQPGSTGKVIRLARLAKGWKQRQLAEFSGYSQSTISRIENDGSRAAHDLHILNDLADTLGLPRPGVAGGITAESENNAARELESDTRPALARLRAEIQARRTSRNWSRQQLAARTTYTVQYVSRAERPGANLPSAGLVRELDEVLEAHGELSQIQREARQEADTLRVMNMPEPIPARSFEGAMQASPSREKSSQIASEIAASLAALPISSSTSNGDTAASVAEIKAMSLAFQIADRRVGGRVLYPQVRRYLSAEIGPKVLAATGDVVDLFAAACSFSEIAGWMAHDGGQDAVARNHLNAAYRLASAAEHDALVGNVCASMSHLASELVQPIDAVRIADAGLMRVDNASGVAALRSRLHAMRARGLAVAGENQASVAALMEAEDVLDEATNEQPADWIASFDAASLASESAMCLRELGDLSGARRNAERVIQLRKGDRVRSRAFGHIMLAEIVAEAGKPDEAAVIGLAVGDTLATLSSERVRSRLEALGRLLRAHARVPEVSSFLEFIATNKKTKEEGSSWPI